MERTMSETKDYQENFSDDGFWAPLKTWLTSG